MFRGNGTIIGASVHVVIVEIVRKAGYQITFWRLFKFGFPVMVSSVALSALYLWLVFLG
jgi:Na+/H+ antiporter NhaD/arsenite permease-like protein